MEYFTNLGKCLCLALMLMMFGAWSSEATSRTLQDASMYGRYEQWMAHYGRVYNDINEKEKRFQIFKENVAYGHECSTKTTYFKYENVTMPATVDWRQKGAVTPSRDIKANVRFTRGAAEQEQVQPARKEEWPRHVYEERVAQAKPKRIPNPASFPQPSLLPKMEATSPKSPHLIPPHKMITKRKKEERLQKLIATTEELQKEQVVLFESISKINKRMDAMNSKIIALFEETVWRESNESVWNHKKKSAVDVSIALAASIHNHRLHNGSSPKGLRQQVIVRWKAPLCGVWKINMNGAFKHATRNGGASFVIWDWEEKLATWGAFPITGLISAEHFELMDCLKAVDFAIDHGFFPCILETDA
ncbi:hypothetical protein ACLB2K_002109 [Fragaria x ananassa]